MNILLLIPSSRFVKTVIRDVLYGCWCCGTRIGSGQLPPLTLLSVATVLKQDGHNVRLLDTSVENLSYEEIVEEVAARDAIIVLTSTMTFIEDTATLTEFKKINPKRTESGQRSYTKKDIEMILEIKHLLHEKKFTIDGARKYINAKAETESIISRQFLNDLRTELVGIRKLLDSN